MTLNGSIELRISQEMLEEGRVRFSERQAETLELPRFSGSLTTTMGSQAFDAQWQARERVLGGELLAEAIQLEAQLRSLLRLHRTEDGIELELVHPHTARARPAVPPRPVPPPKPQRKRRKAAARSRFRFRPDADFDWNGSVGVYREVLNDFATNIEKGAWDSPEFFELRLRGEELAAVSDFDELLAVDVAKVDHMAHQEATALRVLAEMQGRAILADEVGLGKTIETGLIIKEAILRDLAQRILILCPATLRDQWREEMKDKFEEEFRIVASGSESMEGDRLILSTDLGARNIERLTVEPWDVVVVDEAHKLSRQAKKKQQLVRTLESRFLLFLTATPVQNDLLELYRLVELLRPGTFESERAFKQTFIARDDHRSPANPVELRRLVADVMVRTTREQAGLDNVARIPVDVPVNLSNQERQLYLQITEVLRTSMTDRSDHLRRRHLAHRLTTSPRGLHLTASRMAESHPDPAVRASLAAIASTSLDLGVTNRQQSLLDLCIDWTTDQDKGRVLIFTQHNDTLEDLLSVLHHHDLNAVPFNGGMSAGAKRDAIAKFRGDVPIMVSTDAGAEGLNLQFANCVINFDLPWNPMRIEQRIGRVHRVTQRRDVYVANIYATDTVDEHVYRILHDKLRMFELLFGQVTTILGELDDEGSGSTFEQRVMDALTAGDDRKMAQQLSRLAGQVEAAKQRADESIEVGKGVNAWYFDRTYRSSLPGADAKELVPNLELKARQRQTQARQFAHDLWPALGASVEHETNDFMSVTLPEPLATEFGAESLHLAFSAAALGEHADAELFAVGSGLFDEVLDRIRESGDLLAYIPQTTHIPDGALLPHEPRIELVERQVVGPERWSVDTSWRSRLQGGTSGERIVHHSDDAGFATGASLALIDGDTLPETSPPPAKFISNAVHAATGDLSAHAAAEQALVSQRAEADRLRMSEHYERQLEERQREWDLAWNERRQDEIQAEIERITQAQSAYAKASDHQVRVEADLLAMRIVGSPVMQVEERWRRTNGSTVTLAAKLDTTTGSIAYREKAIDRLAICTLGHPIDTSEVEHCDGCGSDRCDSCEALATFRTCPCCSSRDCGECLPTDGSICPRCKSAVREAERDTAQRVAWRLASGPLLLIGERHATLLRADGERLELATVDDVDDQDRVYSSSLAVSLGMPSDTGLQVERVPDPPTDQVDGLTRSETRTWRWEVEPAGGGTVAKGSRLLLADSAATKTSSMLTAIHASGVSDLVAALRADEPPPPVPRLIAREVRSRSTISFSPAGLHRVEECAIGGLPAEATSVSVPLEPVAETNDQIIARCELDSATLTVHSVHRSYVVEAVAPDGLERRFVPHDNEITLESELACLELARRLGYPSDAVLRRVGDDLDLGWADPTHANLIRREITPRWRFGVSATNERALTPGDPLPDPERVERVSNASDVPGWRAAISGIRLRDRRPTYDVELVMDVKERWEGRTSVSRDFTLEPGQSPLPVLRDTRDQASDFAIDDYGHLHEPTSTWTCPTCDGHGCGGCDQDDQLGSCGDCGGMACGRCRRGELQHEVTVVETCERCGARSCVTCGRGIHLELCWCCARQTCTDCRADDFCSTCAPGAFEPVDPAALAEIVGFVPSGVHTMSSSDALTTCALLVGANRADLLVKRPNHLAWWSLGRADLDPVSLRLLRDVTTIAGTSDVRVEVIEEIGAPSDPGDLSIPILIRRTHEVAWELRVDAESMHVGSVELGADDLDIDDAVKRIKSHGLAQDDDRGPNTITPRPAPTTMREAFAPLIDRERAGKGVTLRLQQITSRLRVDVTPNGIRLARFTNGRSDERTTTWAAEASVLHLVEDWTPIPTVVGAATAHDTTAAILDVAGVWVMVVATPEGSVRCLDLSADGHLAIATEVAQAFHTAEPLALVSSYLDDSAFTFPAIENARVQHRAVLPVAQRSQNPPSIEATLAAAHRWSGDIRPTLPEMPIIEHRDDWVAALTGRLGTRVSRPIETVDVSVRIVDTWESPYGTVETTYLPSSGGQLAMVTADGRAVTRGWIDRSRHLTAEGLACPYCETLTCERCDSPTELCVLCHVLVCGHCARGRLERLHVCQACDSLATLGRRDRSREPLASELKKPVLRGADRIHTVVIGQRAGGTQVVRAATVHGITYDAPIDPLGTSWLRARTS